jgi:uncharacterized protein YjbJ (UPF0337 family)
MKPGIKNEIAGKVHEVRRAKTTNDPDLEGKGIAEKTAEKVQNKVGHAERALCK